MPRVTDEQIFEAGIEAFGHHGYHSVSMDQIAAAAGITKPTVYARFVDKSALLDASLARERELLLAHLFTTYEHAKNRPLTEQITTDVDALFAYAIARPHGFRLLFGDHASQQVIGVRREMLDRLEGRIAELVLRFAESPRARQRGVRVTTSGSRLLASLIVSASVRGASEADPQDEERATALARATGTFVLSALYRVDLDGLR